MPQIVIATFNTARSGRTPQNKDVVDRVIEFFMGEQIKGSPYDVARAVRSLEAEIIHLQEVWVPDDANSGGNFLRNLHEEGYNFEFEPFARLGHMSDRKPGRDPERTTGSIGIAIVSKFPLLNRSALDLRHVNRDPFPKRPALAVTIEKDGVPLTTVCVHAPRYLPVGPITYLRRLHQKLPPRGTPVVVAGDLNFPRWATRATMRGFVSGAAGRTFLAQDPLLQIDQVLARKRDVRILGTEAVTPLGSRSDHFAVKAQIEWGFDRRLKRRAS